MSNRCFSHIWLHFSTQKSTHKIAVVRPLKTHKLMWVRNSVQNKGLNKQLKLQSINQKVLRLNDLSHWRIFYRICASIQDDLFSNWILISSNSRLKMLNYEHIFIVFSLNRQKFVFIPLLVIGCLIYVYLLYGCIWSNERLRHDFYISSAFNLNSK